MSRRPVSRRSLSVEVEPTTLSTESPGEPASAVLQSVFRLHKKAAPPTDTSTVSAPLLMPSTSPRTSRFTVPPPTVAHRRQSPRSRRAVAGAAPRKPAAGEVVTAALVSRNGGDSSTTSSTSKEPSKSSDASSSNNHETVGVSGGGVEALTSVCPLVIPEYVEFGAAVMSAASAETTATAEPTITAGAVSSAGVAATEPAPAHEYCYTTAPTLPPGPGLPAAEMERYVCSLHRGLMKYPGLGYPPLPAPRSSL